jgi:hypothetical protein
LTPDLESGGWTDSPFPADQPGRFPRHSARFVGSSSLSTLPAARASWAWLRMVLTQRCADAQPDDDTRMSFNRLAQSPGVPIRHLIGSARRD